VAIDGGIVKKVMKARKAAPRHRSWKRWLGLVSAAIGLLLVAADFVLMLVPVLIFGAVPQALITRPLGAWKPTRFLLDPIARPFLFSPFEFILIGVGALLFLGGAVPVYAAKLRKAGLVTCGIYRWIRHPQYLGVLLMGLSLLFLNPVLLTLIAYLGLVVAYALLAQGDERRLEQRFGEDYRRWKARTDAIFPGDRYLFAWWQRIRPALPRGSLSLFLLLVVFGALSLMRYTLNTATLPRLNADLSLLPPNLKGRVEDAYLVPGPIHLPRQEDYLTAFALAVREARLPPPEVARMVVGFFGPAPAAIAWDETHPIPGGRRLVLVTFFFLDRNALRDIFLENMTASEWMALPHPAIQGKTVAFEMGGTRVVQREVDRWMQHGAQATTARPLAQGSIARFVSRFPPTPTEDLMTDPWPALIAAYGLPGPAPRDMCGYCHLVPWARMLNSRHILSQMQGISQEVGKS